LPRQLAIFFPDGRSEYWLTVRVFEVGDKLDRAGTTWVVTSITSPDGHRSDSEDGDDRHATMTVRSDDDGELVSPTIS
jgi:hypothetical protein